MPVSTENQPAVFSLSYLVHVIDFGLHLVKVDVMDFKGAKCTRPRKNTMKIMSTVFFFKEKLNKYCLPVKEKAA